MLIDRMNLLNSTSARALRLFLGVAVFAGATLFVPAQSAPHVTPLHHKAPAFTRRALSGQTISLSAYKGKVVLLNFWATWCTPCRVELPRFAQWQRQLGPSGFQVIAVSMDDSPSTTRATLKRSLPPFPVLMGDAKLAESYGGILGLPVTFLIARDGTVVRRLEGETNLDDLHAAVQALLAQPPHPKH